MSDSSARFALLDLDDSPSKPKQEPEPITVAPSVDYAAIARAARDERLGFTPTPNLPIPGTVSAPDAPITAVGIDTIRANPTEPTPVECTPAPVEGSPHYPGYRDGLVARDTRASSQRRFTCTCGTTVRTSDPGATQCRRCRDGSPPARSANPLGVQPSVRSAPSPAASPAPAQTPRQRLREQAVFGAEQGATGVLIAWRGAGELTRARILEVLNTGAAPTIKSATRHAADAVGLANRVGYIARRDRSFRGAGAARWRVVAAHGQAELGQDYGTVAVTATLSPDGELSVRSDSPEHATLAAEILAEYQRTTEASSYRAGEVTAWLSGWLLNTCHAVHLGVGWYVPSEYAGTATALCRALREHWGCAWSIGLPVTTTDAWLDSIADDGIGGEIRDLERRLTRDRTEARKQGRADVGEKAATSYVARLRDILGRASAEYTALLGEHRVAGIRSKAQALLTQLEGLCTDTALRGALLELD